MTDRSPRSIVVCVFVLIFAAQPLFHPAHAQEGAGNDGAAPAPAPAPVSIDPGKAAEMLKRLESLKKNRYEGRQEKLLEKIREIEQAAQDPDKAIQYYLDAVEQLRFTSEEAPMGSEYRDWKDERKEVLRSKEFETAVRFHLRYLALTLRFIGLSEQEEKDPRAIESLILELVDYVRDFAREKKESEGLMANNFRQRLSPGELLKRPLPGSEFVRLWHLEQVLGRIDNWEMVPGNLSGIEEKNIRPVLQELAPDRLAEFWDFKIAREESELENETLSAELGRFKMLRLPQLWWWRAEDRLLAYPDNAEAAFEDMYEILDRYRLHPSFEAWVESLEKRLQEGGQNETADADG